MTVSVERPGPLSGIWKLSLDGSWAKQFLRHPNWRKTLNWSCDPVRRWTMKMEIGGIRWDMMGWAWINRPREKGKDRQKSFCSFLRYVQVFWKKLLQINWGISLFVCCRLLAEPLPLQGAYLECRDLCRDASYLSIASPGDPNKAWTSICGAQQWRDCPVPLRWRCICWSSYWSSQQSDQHSPHPQSR